MKRAVVGEGSYGCVHKPSIHCKTPPNPGFDYTTYVSKLMKTKHAEKELAEFVIIKNIDPTDEYHLGEPILCTPKLDEPNVKADISKCKNIKITDVETNPDKYSLLLLKFGGPDLKAFCGNLRKYLKNDTIKRVDEFWLEVHHLIKGLKFFKDNGIVHNDIKPQNILFNLNTGKLRYIDFGLMRTKKTIIELSKNNSNGLGEYHWSYPFDCGFMNDVQYRNYKHRNKERRAFWKEQLSNLIVLNSGKNDMNLPIPRPKSFQILFTYLNPSNVIPSKTTQYGYIDSFFDGFDEMLDNKSYAENLNDITDSIDVFGLGFTLQFMANCFKRLSALPLEDYTRLSTFFHKMYDFNPSTRVIDIEILLNEYENILLEIGILTRLGKSFENNTVVNTQPPFFINLVDENTPEHLSTELEQIANNDAIEITVRCPEEKEINPKTKRCVKKCLPGYYRNQDFKCRKTRKLRPISKNKKTTSSSSKKGSKQIPEGNKINSKTKQHIKNALQVITKWKESKKTRKTKNISSDSSASIGIMNNERYM